MSQLFRLISVGSLVLTYDQLDDRRIDVVISISIIIIIIIIILLLLLFIFKTSTFHVARASCSVTDHRRSQNVVINSISDPLQLSPCVPLICSYHIFGVICDQLLHATDAQQQNLFDKLMTAIARWSPY